MRSSRSLSVCFPDQPKDRRGHERPDHERRDPATQSKPRAKICTQIHPKWKFDALACVLTAKGHQVVVVRSARASVARSATAAQKQRPNAKPRLWPRGVLGLNLWYQAMGIPKIHVRIDGSMTKIDNQTVPHGNRSRSPFRNSGRNFSGRPCREEFESGKHVLQFALGA